MRAFIPVIRLTFLAFLLLTLTGCIQMIQAIYPTYEEVQGEWPAIAKGTGRLVVYWPSNSHFNKSFAKVMIDNDKERRVEMLDNQFGFIDLAAGDHNVHVNPNSIFQSNHVLPVTIRDSEIAYVQINSARYANDPPELVDEAAAKQALKGLRHNFYKPVPFGDK